MKASEFAAHLVDRGASLVLRDGRLIARGASTLPPWTRQALAAHRADLFAYLAHGEDRDLQPTRARAELKRLGFVQIANGRFCHPQGDEKGDAILLGLISPDEVDREAEHARRDINAPPAPRGHAQQVEDLHEVHPGRWRWTEHAGGHYQAPFPHVEREREL